MLFCVCAAREQLFRLPRQRKLSLRFLASRLLGLDVQAQGGGGHDSVEDAATALALYAKYRNLCAGGELEATLLALYRHGKQHGF